MVGFSKKKMDRTQVVVGLPKEVVRAPAGSQRRVEDTSDERLASNTEGHSKELRSDGDDI